MTNILVTNYRYSSISIIMVRYDPSLLLFNFTCYAYQGKESNIDIIYVCMVDGRRMVCKIVRIIEEGEKGRWIEIHLQPLILLISF